MTLIACTIKSHVPAFVSDVLITSTHKEYETMVLPTNTFDVNQYLKTNRWPVSLNQKTYIIKNNVCVSFGGRVHEMTKFLAEFRMRCNYFDIVGEKEIADFLDSYDLENEFSESSFMILAIQETQGRKEVKQFHYPVDKWDIYNGDVFDTIYAWGSGKGDFIHWSKAIEIHPPIESDPVYELVWRNVCIVARLLAIERLSLHTVRKFWGGSFEITLFDGNSFEKLNRFAYVIFQVYFDNFANVTRLVPGLVLYQQYYRDVLFISTIEGSEFEVTANEHTMVYKGQHGTARIFPALPIDRENLDRNEFPAKFSFRTDRIAVGFAFVTEQPISPAAFFGQGSAIIEYRDGIDMTLTVNRRAINEVLNAATAIIRGPSPERES